MTRIFTTLLLAAPGIALALVAKPLLLGDEMILLGVVSAIALPIAFFLVADKSARESAASFGTLENLLATVDKLAPKTPAFQLYVPQTVTYEGKAIRMDIAMAVLCDRILGKQLYPNGFVQKPNGRVYKYTSDPKVLEAARFRSV